jgi:tRNA(adenine34) deaminase
MPWRLLRRFLTRPIPSEASPPGGAPRGGGVTSPRVTGGVPALEQPTSTDLTMMHRALDLARQAAALDEVPIGAVVYETATARILGEGYNRREIDHDPAAHAEFIAIRAAAAALGDWRLTACTLVVTLEPCAMCAGLIVNARVGRLVYGAADPKAGAVRTLYSLTEDPRLNHRVSPISGVLEQECSDLLRAFFAALRKR